MLGKLLFLYSVRKKDDIKTGNNTVAINGIFTLHGNGTGASTWTK